MKGKGVYGRMLRYIEISKHCTGNCSKAFSERRHLILLNVVSKKLTTGQLKFAFDLCVRCLVIFLRSGPPPWSMSMTKHGKISKINNNFFPDFIIRLQCVYPDLILIAPPDPLIHPLRWNSTHIRGIMTRGSSVDCNCKK